MNLIIRADFELECYACTQYLTLALTFRPAEWEIPGVVAQKRLLHVSMCGTRGGGGGGGTVRCINFEWVAVRVRTH